jgi:transcription elongation factor Elf1
MDKLKRAIEQLDAPYCPNCKIEMKWSRSTLVDATTVTHVFVCAACSQTAETKTKVRAADVPPTKLSAPRHRHAA